MDTLAGHHFDDVITLCDKAREACPPVGDVVRRRHWSIPDPAASADLAEFVRVAAEIDNRIRYLLPTLATPNRQEVPA